MSPHAILAVRAITSKTKDTIVLSVEFEAIIKKAFFLKTSGSKVRALLLTSVGTAFCLDVKSTCNVSYTLRYTFAYVLRTRYLMGTKVICMIARA